MRGNKTAACYTIRRTDETLPLTNLIAVEYKKHENIKKMRAYLDKEGGQRLLKYNIPRHAQRLLDKGLKAIAWTQK